MKEIKWTLYTLYVMIYTSSIWCTCLPNEVKTSPIIEYGGILCLLFLTVINIIFVGMYLYNNWNKE